MFPEEDNKAAEMLGHMSSEEGLSTLGLFSQEKKGIERQAHCYLQLPEEENWREVLSSFPWYSVTGHEGMT